ncbi:MAG TPA: hypothetical protein ENN81_03220 [Phycisphaerales bacterium]|mgnify:CR=1 FL=1|nr:hypothetical protein [Phycisphaerales bacterium]
MLRVNRAKKELVKLDKSSLSDSGLTEPYDLQRMILNSPEAFFAEMEEKLLLIGDEVRAAAFVEDRIDLLAVDQQGSLVVIELKRNSHKLHLLQALAYASMVSKWERGEIIAQEQRFKGLSEEEAEQEMAEFLLEDAGSLNDSQRIILIAEDFEYEVLVTAEWLTEVYGLDIRCHRIALSVQNDSEFLTCTCIYPPSEITQHAKHRGRGLRTPVGPWADWDEALDKIANDAVVSFFQQQLNNGCENYLKKRILYYRCGEYRRFFVAARKNNVYVWQYRRFPDDVEYWANTIRRDLDTEPVKDGKCLRFHLSSAADFKGFLTAMNGHLQTVKFSEEGADDEIADEQEGA